MKWEYDRLIVKSDVWNNPLNDESILPLMLDVGNDGWELVSVDDGIAYFKRPREIDAQETPTLKEEK